ncbi:class I adenylate-forming enzyme family protein [Niveispirillum fermenti]|uniref:class I adenylate-forming enzyme family protein n=1 Tax=Niveispirillum fermenti TaxID=1233113 RepID=UPI003A8940D5
MDAKDFGQSGPEREAPRPWPAMSLRAATERLCAPGMLFEMETIQVRGVPMRTWKNQPPTLAAMARRAASLFADNEFIIYEEERIRYGAWFRAVAALAARLLAAGVGRGDQVAIAMRNLPEWPVAFFAITSIGAIAVPLNAWWQGEELRYGLENSGACLLICDEQRFRVVEPLRGQLADLRTVWVARPSAPLAGAEALDGLIGPARDYALLPDRDLPDVPMVPDDEATIFYTSGTSGLPKGALGTHRSTLTCCLANAFSSHRSSLRRGETPPPSRPRISLTVIPLFHVTACNASMMSMLMTGGKMVMMRKWDAVEAMRLIEREKVSVAGGVPTIAWQLLEHPDRHRYDLSSIESMAYGGAPAAPELVRLIDSDLRAQPSSGWGMTETSATVTTHAAEDYVNRPDSCGPPLPVSEIRIMAPDGQMEMPVGEVGELWAFGPQIAKGYWRDPQATQATFIDGWVRTGDLARIDDEGFCYIVDRAKDIVIRGGENIYCIEVENALFAHPAVTDAAVVGVPHRTLGEVPAAIVHLGPGHEADEVQILDWVRTRLAPFKVPVQVRFAADPLPRNANGKILKKQLRALFDPE